MSAFQAGQSVRLRLPARAYSHAGITDPSCIVPAIDETVRVERVRNTRRGVRLTVRGSSHGFSAIGVNAFITFGGTIEVLHG